MSSFGTMTGGISMSSIPAPSNYGLPTREPLLPHYEWEPECRRRGIGPLEDYEDAFEFGGRHYPKNWEHFIRFPKLPPPGYPDNPATGLPSGLGRTSTPYSDTIQDPIQPSSNDTPKTQLPSGPSPSRGPATRQAHVQPNKTSKASSFGSLQAPSFRSLRAPSFASLKPPSF